MTVKIENMAENPGNGVATFDATFPDGWVIRRCVVVRRPNGRLSALPPLVREGIRAVGIPQKYWFQFITAALDAYGNFVGGAPDSGRLGVAEADSLTRAGL